MTWPKCFFFIVVSMEREREREMSIFIAEGVVWGGRRLPHVQIKLAEVLSREHLQQIQDMLWVVCWYRVFWVWSNR